MKTIGDYDYIALIHRLAFVSGRAHRGPAFLLWHRKYVKRCLFILKNKIINILYKKI